MIWEEIAKWYIVRYLKSKDVERMRALVEQGIPLWQTEEKKSMLDGLPEFAKQRILAADGDKVTDLVYSAVVEGCPELPFVTKEYVARSVAHFQQHLSGVPRRRVKGEIQIDREV